MLNVDKQWKKITVDLDDETPSLKEIETIGE